MIRFAIAAVKAYVIVIARSVRSRLAHPSNPERQR